MINDLLIRQLIDIANASDLAVVSVKDEQGNTVLVSIGDQEWMDEFFADFY
jgi:hypothetical protein